MVWSDARELVAPSGSPELSGDSGYLARAEGSTSLLDVGLKALALRVAPKLDPLRAAGWMGMGWLLLLVGSSVSTARRWTGSWYVAGLTGCFFALSPGLVESAGYLLEGPLFALLWTSALIAAVEARPGLCALCSVLLAAARPEGLLLAPVLVSWAGYRARYGTAAPSSAPSFGGWPWRWVGVGLGCSLAVTSLRWLRFRDLVPNTYYAKASDSPLTEVLDGLGYLRAVLWGPGAQAGPSLSALGVSVSLAMAATILWRRTRRVPSASGVRGAARGLLVLSALYAAVVVASGGDSYEGARLFMPVAIPVWLGLAASHGRPVRPSRLVNLSMLLALATLIPASVGTGLSNQRPSTFLSSTWQALAAGPVGLEAFEGDAETFRAVALALGPAPETATGSASGAVFAHVHTQRFRWFEPSTPVLDLTGLTDRRIARLPAEGPIRFGRFALAEALRQQVPAIHLDPQRARLTSIVDAPSLVEALCDPTVAGRYVGEPFMAKELARALARDYVGASRVLPQGQGYFNLLVHRSRADGFRSQGFRVGS